MFPFKAYQSYKLNTDKFASSKFQVTEAGDVVGEKTFIDLLESLKLYNAEEGFVQGYEIEESISGSIRIIIGEVTHYVRAEHYQLGILKTILTCQKLSKWGWGLWSWYFVESDSLSEAHTFFVCEGDKIIEDQINLYDVPENLFQAECQHPGLSDPDELKRYYREEPYQMALVRQNYENFYN